MMSKISWHWFFNSAFGLYHSLWGIGDFKRWIFFPTRYGSYSWHWVCFLRMPWRCFPDRGVPVRRSLNHVSCVPFTIRPKEKGPWTMSPDPDPKSKSRDRSSLLCVFVAALLSRSFLIPTKHISFFLLTSWLSRSLLTTWQKSFEVKTHLNSLSEIL